METSHFTIDDRQELHTDLAGALRTLGYDATVSRLETGDVFWWVYAKEPLACCVEIKTLGDLAGSARSGRLGAQMRRMLEYPLRFLLVEGGANMEYVLKGGWTISGLDNLLVSAQLAGIVTCRSENKFDTPFRLAALKEYTGKEQHKSMSTPTIPLPQNIYVSPTYRAKLGMLMCIPGMGEERANAALKWAGNDLKKILGADEKELQEIEGVGKGVASKVRRFLGYNGK